MFYEEEYQNGIVAWNLNSHSVFELFSDQIKRRSQKNAI